MNKNIPNLEFSPSHVSIGFSQIVFPTRVWPQDDRADFVQKERLGLPYWTMILAIRVVVDESKCLDTPIWESSIICEHLPFLLGCKPILRLLLVHRNLAICVWYPWFWRLSFEMLKILAQWILHKARIVFYNITAENNSTFVLLVFCFQFSILQMTDVHQWCNMNCSAQRPWFIDHLFLTSDFRQVPPRNFLQFSHSLSTAAFAVGIFMIKIPHTHSGGFIGFQNTRKFCLVFVRSATPTNSS